MSNTGAAAGVTVGRAAGGTGGDADAWSCNEPLDGFKVVAVGVASPWKILNLGGGVLLHAVAQCMPAADNEPCNSVSGSWPLYSVRDVLQHLPAALNVTARCAQCQCFQLGANIERPQPVTKSSAKDRHAAGARPAPAQCKCTNVRVSDSVCPLVPKRLAIKVNFRQGRLVVFGSLPEDEDIGRASRQIAFSRLRYGRLCGSELVICASIIPFFWRRLQRHRDNAIQPTLSTKRVAYEWVRCDDFTPDKAGSTWATWRFTIPTARLVVSLTHTYI